METSSDLLLPDRDARPGSSAPEKNGPAAPDSHHSVTKSPIPPHRAGRLILVVAAILVACLVMGLLPRLRERHSVAADTLALAQPTVAVVKAAPARAGAPLVLSGELKPEMDASIHARVNGYVRRWLVDLGAKVEAGQLLVELDTPDTDRELSQARAQLVQAEAARDLAATTAKRWKEMLAAKTVSAQETDEKAGDLELKKATVEAARANVQRLEQIAGFARITAPFAGTISIRRIDVGDLITAGEGQELFRLVQTEKLRVFVRVPQNYARGTTIGQSADLMLSEFPGRKFPARIVRTAGALDPATRTLLTELEVDNAQGEILSGSYAQVRLADAKPEAALTLPANTLMFRPEGTVVAIVADHKVTLRTVSLGRDFGSALEIRSGVTADDQVIVNPSDSLTEGMQVQVAEAKQ
jgi:RND family efflux transporter MFP subunit